LEKESQNSDFWLNQERASKVSQEISELKETISEFEKIKKELEELKELESLSEKDEGMAIEVKNKMIILEKEINSHETKVFLSGKHDKNNTILEIFSGAGGVDAQDWATIILRMYQKYCGEKGFEANILHQSFGEAGGPEGRIGTKSATLEIKGKYAYGLLKKETGVHRLVRLSPFSAKKLRHTSFVLVQVLPEFGEKEEQEIEIKPEEVKIDFYRASGPGGQNVNKRESAVRITHLPTGIIANCQMERSQSQNREMAMKILCSKLYQVREENRTKEAKEVKGDRVSASWGNQIRSYVLHPYKMVKDLRTGVETSDAENVLDGNLDKFIEAEIKNFI